MALNSKALLLLAMIVMVSFTAVVNGQNAPAISPDAAVNEELADEESAEAEVNEQKAKAAANSTPVANAVGDQWKQEMIKALSEPVDIQVLSVKSFIDVELPLHLDQLRPEDKNSVIDGCLKSTQETLHLLEDAAKGIEENQPKEKLVQTLSDAENAGRGCIYALAHYDIDVPSISALVMEFETSLRQAVRLLG